MLAAYGIMGEKPQQRMRFTGISRDNALIEGHHEKVRRSARGRYQEHRLICSFQHIVFINSNSAARFPFCTFLSGIHYILCLYWLITVRATIFFVARGQCDLS